VIIVSKPTFARGKLGAQRHRHTARLSSPRSLAQHSGALACLDSADTLAAKILSCSV
jgi:hypothetical protein